MRSRTSETVSHSLETDISRPLLNLDVGGGNDKNTVRNTLANPSLRWMVTEILKTNSGVIFKKDAFEERLPTLAAKVKAFQSAQRPSSSYLDVKSHHSGHPSETTTVNGSVMTPPLTPGSSYMKKTHGETMGAGHHDHVDEPKPEEEANGKPHDMLWAKPLWWILEFFPLQQPSFDKNGRPVERTRYVVFLYPRWSLMTPVLTPTIQIAGILEEIGRLITPYLTSTPQ